jgi:hypothetical protein
VKHVPASLLRLVEVGALLQQEEDHGLRAITHCIMEDAPAVPVLGSYICSCTGGCAAYQN